MDGHGREGDDEAGVESGVGSPRFVCGVVEAYERECQRMIIKFLRDWRGHRKGEVWEGPRGLAEAFVQCHAAEVLAVKPERGKVRSGEKNGLDGRNGRRGRG